MFERWVDVKDYPNYAVSNHGRVLNKKRDVLMNPSRRFNGNLRVSLSKNGVTDTINVASLVAQAFLGLEDMTEQVLNADGDKDNNRVENLRIRKRYRMTVPRNEPISPDEPYGNDRHWGRRIQIKETGEIFRTVRDCAKYIQGDYSTIYACLRDERGSHRGFTFRYLE